MVTFIVVFATASGVGSIAAQAGNVHGGGGHHHHSHHPGNPQGNGQYVPLERTEGPFEEGIAACGTTLSLTDGDVFRLKERVTEKKLGTLYEYKGAYTTDVAAADGRVIDELDNSGPYSAFVRTNGSLTFEVHAPALIYPTSPEEEAAFRAAGLPSIFYFTKGTFIDTIGADGSVSIAVAPHKVTNVCNLLRQP